MTTIMIAMALLQTAAPAPSAEPAAQTRMRAGMQARFERMDADKDGAVTKAEADAAMAARGQGGGGRGGNWFARADADKDGKVTSAEMQQMRTARMRRLEDAPEQPAE